MVNDRGFVKHTEKTPIHRNVHLDDIVMLRFETNEADKPGFAVGCVVEINRDGVFLSPVSSQYVRNIGFLIPQDQIDRRGITAVPYSHIIEYKIVK